MTFFWGEMFSLLKDPWWGRDYRMLFWMPCNLLAVQLSRKKRSEKMVFTFQRRQYFRQDPPWHTIHSWGPSYFNRVGVFLQLDFSVILHPSLAVWMEQWRVYSAVYLPVYWCQNEQRCCCTWKLSSISWEKIFLYTTSRLSLWESFMRNYVLVWSVSEGWGSLAWYVFNPQSIHVQC